MRLLDEKKRLFGIINPVDLIVILGVIAVVVVIAGVLFGWGDKVTVTATNPITFDVVCPNVSDYSEDSVKVGDTISKLNTGPVGKVVGVKVAPTVVEDYDPNKGEGIEFESKNLVTVTISVEGRGKPTPQGVVVGGATVRNFELMPIVTDRFECATARIARLRIEEE